jgi:hypothetical protein
VSVEQLLADHADSLEDRWARLVQFVSNRFHQDAPGVESILFLIGIQSRGRGFEPKLEKELKQAVIMEGTYAAMATLGFYRQIGMERDGACIWERTGPEFPALSVEDQETLLKIAILRYFDEAGIQPA